MLFWAVVRNIGSLSLWLGGNEGITICSDGSRLCRCLAAAWPARRPRAREQAKQESEELPAAKERQEPGRAPVLARTTERCDGLSSHCLHRHLQHSRQGNAGCAAEISHVDMKGETAIVSSPSLSPGGTLGRAPTGAARRRRLHARGRRQRDLARARPVAGGAAGAPLLRGGGRGSGCPRFDARFGARAESRSRQSSETRADGETSSKMTGKHRILYAHRSLS